MRSLAIWILLIALVSGRAAARDETIEELKARAQNTLPQDRPRLYIQIAELQLRSADKLYKDGEVEQARAAVDEIVSYSEQARDSATTTQKHLKNVEIAARKMAERLRNIKRTLALEDQAPVEHAVQRLEAVRTALLKQMFSKEKKK